MTLGLEIFSCEIAFYLFNLPYCVEKLKSRKNNWSLIFFHRYVQPSLLSKTLSKSSFKWFTLVLCIIELVFIDFRSSLHIFHQIFSVCSVLVDVIVYQCRLTAILLRHGCQGGDEGETLLALARAFCRVRSVPRTRNTKLASSHQSQSVPARLVYPVCPRPSIRDFSLRAFRLH